MSSGEWWFIAYRVRRPYACRVEIARGPAYYGALVYGIGVFYVSRSVRKLLR